MINITKELSLSHNFPCKWVLYGLVFQKVLWFGFPILPEDRIIQYSRLHNHLPPSWPHSNISYHSFLTASYCPQHPFSSIYRHLILILKQLRSQTSTHPPRFLTLAVVQLQVSSIKNSLTSFCEEQNYRFLFGEYCKFLCSLRLSSLTTNQSYRFLVVCKDNCAVYVEKSQREQFVIPVAYWNHHFSGTC